MREVTSQREDVNRFSQSVDEHPPFIPQKIGMVRHLQNLRTCLAALDPPENKIVPDSYDDSKNVPPHGSAFSGFPLGGQR